MILEMVPGRIIDQVEDELGLTDRDVALAVGVNLRTMERWRAGETYPQRDARQRLAALLALRHHLRETFSTAEAIRVWTHTDSRYLGGFSPADALRVGRIERVEAALEALDSGAFV